MTNIEIVQDYFQVSNKSQMSEIRKLMTESTTYSSPNTGLYLGVDNIIDMQDNFHNSFSHLNWEVTSYSEIKSGIVLCDFNFIGEKKNGESISFSAKEYIIIFEGKIQHIEIK